MTTLDDATAALYRRGLPHTRALAYLLGEIADDADADRCTAGTWAAACEVADTVTRAVPQVPLAPEFLAPDYPEELS